MCKLLTFFIMAIIGLVLTACDDAANVASRNISKASDNFEIARRVVFYNGITGTYMLEIVGRCSLDLGDGNNIKVTCMDDNGNVKKHYLGRSDNVTYFVEQLDPAVVSTHMYRVTFNPLTILPDVRLAK